LEEWSVTFWIVFHLVIGIFLLIDLTIRGRDPEATFKKDVIWSVIWIAVGLAFGAYVFWHYGHEEGLKYITAYVVEKSLSVDNLFVFLAIFRYFAVPFVHQHKVLFLGILCAIVFRGAFIVAGIALLERFHWMVYIFGGVLLYSGYKLIKSRLEEVDVEKNRVVRLARRVLPISPQYVGGKFFVREGDKMVFTPLILVLLAIETTDIMFAFDSVPAVLAVTEEFFTAYTSNIMAVLGLRALYFVLARALRTLTYLSRGLAIVLIFLGCKFILGGLEVKLPTLLSLSIVLGIISISALLSLIKKIWDRLD
jgi:tellurite resistance protein TerC